MATSRAKFHIHSEKLIAHVYGQEEPGHEFEMTAVTNKGPGADAEDEIFARMTPTGNIRILVCNPAALPAFRLGKDVYVDFTSTEE